MPDASPARLTLDVALEEGLAAMFRHLQAQPASEVMINLVDHLEDLYRRAGALGGESRIIP